MKKILLISSLFILGNIAFAQPKTSTKKANSKPKVATKTNTEEFKKSTDTLVEITTKFGVMKARLYNNTPLHRDNFIKLVRSGAYDGLLFHRVINGFMIQGGDPASKNADANTMLGNGEMPNTPMIDAEFRPELIHKKGALCAARTENPEKKSSNCQFYIVQGRKTDSTQLGGKTYTKEQKEIYARIGGTPFLDQNYTVFGEVYFGLDVIDKIAATKTSGADRPVEDVRMSMRIINK